MVKDYTENEKENGIWEYKFQLVVDINSTTLSWTQKDDYIIAINNIQEILSDSRLHLDAKTEKMNNMLNDEIPYFRCSDEDIVKVILHVLKVLFFFFFRKR
jgi:hypothetical protein